MNYGTLIHLGTGLHCELSENLALQYELEKNEPKLAIVDSKYIMPLTNARRSGKPYVTACIAGFIVNIGSNS